MNLNADRIHTLTGELTVLDHQRRALVAELKRLSGPIVRAGSVISRVLVYLRHFADRPASTAELLTYVLAKRPRLSRRACSVQLYRAARIGLIVRQGKGWVLPEDAGAQLPGRPSPVLADEDDNASEKAAGAISRYEGDE